MYASHLNGEHHPLVFSPKKNGIGCALCGRTYLWDRATWSSLENMIMAHVLLEGEVEDHILKGMSDG